MKYKYKVVALILSVVILCMLTACPMCEIEERQDIFYIENNSDRVVFAILDKSDVNSEINLDSIETNLFANFGCGTIPPHETKPAWAYMSRQEFFKRHPEIRVHITTDPIYTSSNDKPFVFDSILKTYTITKASLMADGWVLKYEEDTTGQQ